MEQIIYESLYIVYNFISDAPYEELDEDQYHGSGQPNLLTEKDLSNGNHEGINTLFIIPYNV